VSTVYVHAYMGRCLWYKHCFSHPVSTPPSNLCNLLDRAAADSVTFFQDKVTTTTSPTPQPEGPHLAV
jgi:hypothetical protein